MKNELKKMMLNSKCRTMYGIDIYFYLINKKNN